MGCGGWGEVGKGQKLQTSSYKISKAWGCNIHIATIVNNTALHIWMLLRECILIVLITRKQFFCNMYGDGCEVDLLCW